MTDPALTSSLSLTMIKHDLLSFHLPSSIVNHQQSLYDLADLVCALTGVESRAHENAHHQRVTSWSLLWSPSFVRADVVGVCFVRVVAFVVIAVACCLCCCYLLLLSSLLLLMVYSCCCVCPLWLLTKMLRSMIYTTDNLVSLESTTPWPYFGLRKRGAVTTASMQG